MRLLQPGWVLLFLAKSPLGKASQVSLTDILNTLENLDTQLSTSIQAINSDLDYIKRSTQCD